MSRIKWDLMEDRTIETGCDHGVLFPMVGSSYPKGTAWNGLISATETPSGAEPNDLYADNIKYLSLRSAEDFGGTIECYSTPEEFDACDGLKEVAPGVTIGQQGRQSFGFSFRSKKGDATDQDKGYIIHLWYGCSATPSERAYNTTNDSPDAATFSYEISSIPIPVNNGLKPTACMLIDSTKVDQDKLKVFEDILYGTDGEDATDPKLMLPEEIIEFFAAG